MQITIIIPIYNTGARLKRCINSILNQTFIDYECLMVDDGSEKETAQLVDQYAINDSRFIAIHKQNGGVSSARNYGLERAKGNWIVFVDSDDYLTPDHIEKLISASNDEVDIVMTGFKDIRTKDSWEHKYGVGKYVGIDQMKQMFRETDFLEHQIPWDRMYRNKYNIRFNEKLSLSEDRLFCYNYLLHCKGISTIPDVTYLHDATDSNSLTYRKYPSGVNEYKYKEFKQATHKLIRHYDMIEVDRKTLDEYLEGTYAILINSYKDEGKIFQYYKARILHKLNLL